VTHWSSRLLADLLGISRASDPSQFIYAENSGQLRVAIDSRFALSAAAATTECSLTSARQGNGVYDGLARGRGEHHTEGV
jgi:hypothetical protein